MKYTVRIEETIYNEVEIEAVTEEEAVRKATEMACTGEVDPKFSDGVSGWIEHDYKRENVKDRIKWMLSTLPSDDRAMLNYDLWKTYQRKSLLEDLNLRLEENETEMTDAEKEKTLDLFEKWINDNDYFWSCYWSTMDDVIGEVKKNDD